MKMFHGHYKKSSGQMEVKKVIYHTHAKRGIWLQISSIASCIWATVHGGGGGFTMSHPSTLLLVVLSNTSKKLYEHE
jgi:hypothetical protein